MTDRKGHNDDISTISSKLRNISTNDPNSNNLDISLKNQYDSDSSLGSTINLSTSDDQPLMKDLGMNIPEKIIFVIDTVKEMDSTEFEMSSGNKLSSLDLVKRAMEIFVNAKSAINPNHEFAMMALTEDSCNWLLDFTNEKKTFLKSLYKIEEITVDFNQKVCDLTLCFEQIHKHVYIDYIEKLPPYLTRVIIIYSRSYCQPQFLNKTVLYEMLMDNPYFFCDVLYVHEASTEHNKIDEIWKNLVELDVKQSSYILEVGRNAALLHTNMAQLMAHPLQRPKQNECCYKYFNDVRKYPSQTNI